MSHCPSGPQFPNLQNAATELLLNGLLEVGPWPRALGTEEELTAANSGGKAGTRRGHQLSVSLHRGAENLQTLQAALRGARLLTFLVPSPYPWAIRNVPPKVGCYTRAMERPFLSK